MPAAGVPVWWAVIQMAIAMAISYIAAEMMKKSLPSAQADGFGGIKSNTRSTTEPVRVVYGTQRIGGNDVYMYTAGKENKYLYIVQALAEGTCDSIKQRGGVDQVWLGDKLYNQYGGNVSYWFHDGSASQTVDTHIPDALWTDAMRNTCYIVFKLKYNVDYFQGIPPRQVELKGTELFDFRDDSTAYSDNLVLCLYDYFTNSRYGWGKDSGTIDIDSWTTVANYCDTQDWHLDMVIKENENVGDVINNILRHFRGVITTWDGKYYLHYQDLYEESSVMTIEDKHIAQDGSGKQLIKITQPGRFNKPNGIRVSFIDKDKKYAVDSLMIGEQSGVINNLELLGCTRRQHASDIGIFELERARLDRVISGTFRDDCALLEPNDVVTFNSTTLGIEDQLMRVVSTNLTELGYVDIGLQYESYDLYDDDYDIDIESEYECSLPDPNELPPDVSNAQMEERTYYERLRTYSMLSITFDEPVDYTWFKDVEVWQSLTGSGYIHQYNTTNDFEIGPVTQDEKYYIKLVTRNIWGVKQSFNSATLLTHTVVGKSTAPQSLDSLAVIANDNAINLYADKLLDPDIEVYEFRYGDQWMGGIFLASLRSPNYSIKGVKPGAFTFYANTKGTNGVYGSTAVSASTTINTPKGWTAYDTSTYTDDYTPSSSGTHDNTEHYVHNADDYLKCSHSGSLTGTYTSKVFDLGEGNDDWYFAYVEASTLTIGAGTVWDDITASGTLTWDDINATTTSWNEAAEINEAPQIGITLKYKVNIGDDWSEAPRMELCSVVAKFRYFQVFITITDPLEPVNALVKNLIVKLYN